MRVAVLAGVVLLLSCSGEIPDEPDAGEPVPCQTSDECPEGYRCGADSVRQRDDYMTPHPFGSDAAFCLPVCTDLMHDGCALPACDPWTEEEADDRYRELKAQSDARPSGDRRFDWFDCGPDVFGAVDIFWTCGYASGIVRPLKADWPEGEGRPWAGYDENPCPLFFGPDADPDPWPFTF